VKSQTERMLSFRLRACEAQSEGEWSPRLRASGAPG
jgi:hypothetical protein